MTVSFSQWRHTDEPRSLNKHHPTPTPTTRASISFHCGNAVAQTSMISHLLDLKEEAVRAVRAGRLRRRRVSHFPAATADEVAGEEEGAGRRVRPARALRIAEGLHGGGRVRREAAAQPAAQGGRAEQEFRAARRVTLAANAAVAAVAARGAGARGGGAQVVGRCSCGGRRRRCWILDAAEGQRGGDRGQADRAAVEVHKAEGEAGLHAGRHAQRRRAQGRVHP